ncbi:hypothetical protein [Rhizobium sp. BK376]|uniref:hypothetical protein n=1 Tax=Rhizobium sp. BK376 TaxID=2512149 RepID=UPI00104B9F1D|nr:hypothetical protein [Rhizobium sp. BK376]TCR80785.1 hypothetical protein EV561_11362 [Rhizobium sp. BK376]
MLHEWLSYAAIGVAVLGAIASVISTVVVRIEKRRLMISVSVDRHSLRMKKGEVQPTFSEEDEREPARYSSHGGPISDE